MRQSMVNGTAALAPTPERDMLAAGIDIIPDRKNNLGAKRLKRGECPTCGVQTHKVAFLGKNKPLTVEGQVYKGRCLNCHPLEGYIRRPPANAANPQMGGQHPDAPLVIPRTLEVGIDDEDFSVVSGITMDMRLIQGARNWDPSQGAVEDYDSEEEPPAGLPNRRPEPSVGGDDPYADSRPDPDIRPPRSMPSYTQHSIRNMGMRPGGGQSTRDFVGGGGGYPSRKPPPGGRGPGRFSPSTQHLMGQSQASMGAGGMRRQQNYMPDGPSSDRKPPFQQQQQQQQQPGFNGASHPNDNYDYPNDRVEDDYQNDMPGPPGGYNTGNNGQALDEDGYPVATSGFGWNKEADLLPPGGMAALFNNRRPSANPNRASITSNNNEIEFNPSQKNVPPPPATDFQQPIEEFPPPVEEYPPPIEEVGNKPDEPRHPNRISSLESGPMYQSDDFPAYVEDDDIPGPIKETRLTAQTSGPVFYASETMDDEFQMDTLPPQLMPSKTTGPDMFARFNSGRSLNSNGPPIPRPGMASRLNSENTQESFAPPLISRNLRGRADDDIMDPMSGMPAPIGMPRMDGGRGNADPMKAAGAPIGMSMMDGGRGNRQDDSRATRPMYGEMPPPGGPGNHAVHFSQRNPETMSPMPYNDKPTYGDEPGYDDMPRYNDEPNDFPPPGDYGRDARNNLNQRNQGMESTPYEGDNRQRAAHVEVGRGDYGMSELPDDGPMFDDDMDDRNNFKYGAKGPSNAGPPADFGRADYGRDSRDNHGYGMPGPPDGHGIEPRNNVSFGMAVASGDRGMESRQKAGYGVAGARDTGSLDDHGMQSLGSRDYDLGAASGPAVDHGMESRSTPSNDRKMSNSPVFMPEERKPAKSGGDGFGQQAYASSPAPPASAQVNTMLKRLSMTEPQSPTRNNNLSPKTNKQGKRSKDKGQSIHDIPAILHCLNLDEANSNLREKALLSLSEILWKSGEKARSFIVEHKGIDTLVKTMWADISDAKVQAAALAFLFSLSASPDGRASGDMLSDEESICDTLLFSMQTHVSDPGIQLHGCTILACLANASSNNVKISDGSLSGALLMVVNAMSHHSRSREIQKAGLQALYYQCLLSTNAESNKRTLMESTLDNGGSGMDAVMGAMKTLQDDIVAMEWACCLCWCLTSSQDLVKWLSTTAVAGIIVELCSRYIPDPDASGLMEAAFGVIANLSYLDNKRNELEGLGVVPCLIDGMRHHAKDAGVTTEACSAVANLAVSPLVREAMVHAGVIDGIIYAMQAFEDDEELVSEATRALVCLSIDSEDSKETIAGPEIMKAIAQANARHREARQLHEMSCGLLASLAVGQSSLAKLIVGNGGVDTIIRSLAATSDEKVRDAACLAYRNLACQLEDSDQILQKGAVNAVVQAMGKYGNSVSIQINGCCTFWNLAYKTEREPGTIVGSEGIKNIVKAMQSHLESGELLELACGALWSLVDDSVERKKDVVGNGAIDAVACAVVMHPGRVSTLEKAFGVLSNLSLERPLAEAIANAQGVSILVEAMRNNGSSVPMLEVGCTALRNLIFQFPDFAPEASSVVSVIINSMKDNPDEVSFQQEACNLLWVLAAEAENCQSKILALDGVAVVMKCMEIPEVQESALGAFRQLASGSNMSVP